MMFSKKKKGPLGSSFIAQRDREKGGGGGGGEERERERESILIKNFWQHGVKESNLTVLAVPMYTSNSPSYKHRNANLRKIYRFKQQQNIW